MLDQPSTGWTKDRTAILRKMWNEGASASEIASTLGYVTRSGVLGKVHRLNLPKRTMPAHEHKHTQDRASHARASAEPTFRREPGFKIAKPDREGVKLLSADVWKPLPGTEPVALEHVTGCRWPIGDPLSPDFCMCNAPRVEGSSYCRTHKRASEPKRP